MSNVQVGAIIWYNYDKHLQTISAFDTPNGFNNNIDKKRRSNPKVNSQAPPLCGSDFHVDASLRTTILPLHFEVQ